MFVGCFIRRAPGAFIHGACEQASLLGSDDIYINISRAQSQMSLRYDETTVLSSLLMGKRSADLVRARETRADLCSFKASKPTTERIE